MKQSIRRIAVLGAGLTLSIGTLGPAVSAGHTSATPTTVDPAISAWDALLPDDWAARREAAAARLGIESSPATEALERVINPDDYECGPTDLDAYVDGLLAGMTNDQILFLVFSGVLDFPTYDALIFGRDTDPAYDMSVQSATLHHTFRDVKRFWDVESSDIQLHAMHGDMLLDTGRVARLLVAFYGFTEAEADAYAAAVADVIASVPAFDGGNNPIFTLNAFAFTGEGEPDPLLASVPDKLIFGDGIMDALSFMGIADVGPRVVMGHEFGHHVQFEDNLFDSPLTGPEATRRTELMADAFATYFGVHARGLALNAKRVLDTQKTFFEVGDCAFDDPGHHGTPNQRMRSATWAADLATAARPQGRILPSLTFAELFEAELPELVAPDAE
jgi:hypothetical protein